MNLFLLQGNPLRKYCVKDTNSNYTDMLRLTIFIISITFSSLTFGQKIKNIKKKASENKTQKTNSNKNNNNKTRTYSNNNKTSAEDVASTLDACFGCLSLFGDLAALSNNQSVSPEEAERKRLARLERAKERETARIARLERAEENRLNRIEKRKERQASSLYNHGSLELMLNASIAPNVYNVYRGNIRLGYDIFSTEYRYNTYFEKLLDETYRFDMHDWQIIQIHPVRTKYVDWHLGAGIVIENLYDGLKKSTFGEFTTGLEVFALETDLKISPEFRVAQDFNTGNTPRVEVNGQIQYAAINNQKFKIYLGLDAVYTRFYASEDLWSIGIGTHIVIK